MILDNAYGKKHIIFIVKQYSCTNVCLGGNEHTANCYATLHVWRINTRVTPLFGITCESYSYIQISLRSCSSYRRPIRLFNNQFRVLDTTMWLETKPIKMFDHALFQRKLLETMQISLGIWNSASLIMHVKPNFTLNNIMHDKWLTRNKRVDCYKWPCAFKGTHLSRWHNILMAFLTM